MSRRVVVTGLGLVSPLGLSVEESWRKAKAGQSGIDKISLFDATGFPVQIAGEVRGFVPENYLDRKDVKKMDRFIQFAMAAAKEAIGQSGLQVTPKNAERVGVAIGSGIGGLATIESQHKTLIERGPSRISPFFIPGIIINMASGQVSIAYGAKGPNISTVTACATSSHSVGESLRIIQRGDADVMISGGAEAAVSSLAVAGLPRYPYVERASRNIRHAARREHNPASTASWANVRRWAGLTAFFRIRPPIPGS